MNAPGTAPVSDRRSPVTRLLVFGGIALILSGMLMLRHLGEIDAAARLENAVAAVIKEGKHVTYDLKADRNDPTAVGTKEMAQAICEKLKK